MIGRAACLEPAEGVSRSTSSPPAKPISSTPTPIMSASTTSLGGGVDLRCLDGLRAVSALTVCLFHCWMGFVTLAFVPWDRASVLGRHQPLLRLALFGGPFAVDFYLLLTAMLAAYQLVPALEGTSGGGGGSSAVPSPRAVVARYWRRRALRLLPAYVAANLLAVLALGPRQGASAEVHVARAFAFQDCPASLWRNALLVLNYFPIGSCGSSWWTISLQAQFFLAFPLALMALRPRAAGFRTRLAAALAAAFVGGVAWRLWLAATAPLLHLPLTHLGTYAQLDHFWGLQTSFYFSAGSRVAELALGAAMGLLLRTPAALGWLRRRRALVGAAALALQAAAYQVTQTSFPVLGIPGEQLWSPATSRLFAALLYWGGPLMAGMVGATMLALVLHADPLHAAAAKALASPRLAWLSARAYSFYLVNDHARVWLMLVVPAGLLPALLPAAPVAGTLLLFAANTAVGLGAAALLHRWVESRF